MATVLITGGTGLIGGALTAALLHQGHHVIVVTRNPDEHAATSGVRYVKWDIDRGTIDHDAFASADHIIHLAGAGVADKRWTAKRKKEIRDSRTRSGELLVKALKEIPNRVQTFIAASAIGYYGPDPVIPNPAPFVETDPPHDDFLATTCVLWEQSVQEIENTPIRHVQCRIGIVMSKHGGAFASFRKPLAFGIAGILGSGQQVISWIHIEDLVRFFTMALDNTAIRGVYNLVAPTRISNKDFTLQLARQLRGRNFIPVHVPAFALKIGLGEMSIEVLKSASVSSSKLQLSGFTFLYPSIESALQELTRDDSAAGDQVNK